MTTFFVLAFLTYLLWAPALTIGVLVYSLRHLEADLKSLCSALIHGAFLTVVAGPAGMTEGPLPGLLPWWMLDQVGSGLGKQNYVWVYVVGLTLVYAIALIVKAARTRPDD